MLAVYSAEEEENEAEQVKYMYLYRNFHSP